jgi:putative membrane protein
MVTLAWHDGGPGPWVLLVPLVWAAVVAAVVTTVRRAGWRGGPWQHRTAAPGGENSPMAVLGRRFAAGEIDEEEYWRRMSVLEEHFARARVRKGGAG